QEDDEFEGRNVDARRQHVDGDDDLRLGAIAEFTNPLQRAVNVRIACDLLDEVVALIEDFAAGTDELVGVRGVGDVVDGQDQYLRESPGLLLVLVGVFRDLFDDLAVAVRRGDLTFDLFRRERAFVFQFVKDFIAGRGVYLADRLAFAQKDAVHPNVRI